MLKMMLLVVFGVFVGCYDGDRKICLDNYADCVANCGDQQRFQDPISNECAFSCSQNLSICVRRARQ